MSIYCDRSPEKIKKFNYILCFWLTSNTRCVIMTSNIRFGGVLMKISGLQKLTLLDYPGKVACTVFTAGCNMRCPFCHNASLVLDKPEDSIDEEKLIDFLKKRVGVLDGVVITGGEPLLHGDIPNLLKRIKELGYKIKLDTNGTRPELLKQLVSEGLVDRVAMDIKNAPDKYGGTVGIDRFDISPVSESKEFLMNCGIEYEFRTTVVKGIHTEESLLQLAGWIKGANEYYLQQFKDSGNLIDANGLEPFSEDEMKKFADAVREYVPTVKVRGI